MATLTRAFEAWWWIDHHGDWHRSFRFHCVRNQVPASVAQCISKLNSCHTYTGEILKVLGSREVEVSYGQHRAHLQLMVVSGDGPCLLGRDSLQHLQLDWPNICLFQSASVQEILAAHPEVFRKELGTLQSYKATIHVESSACQFCKAR